MTYVYLFGGILLVLLAVVVAAALREGGGEAAEEGGAGSPGERLEATLEALREVEFDYRTGKLPEEEYRALRRRWGRRALRARAELVEVEGPGAPEVEGGETPAGEAPPSGGAAGGAEPGGRR